MKLIFSFTILLFASFSYGQTVTKVNGTQALIDLKGTEKWAIGTTVQFLDENLAITAVGKVLKVSSGNMKALVKIESGKVKAGMTLESEASKENIVTSGSKSEGVTYTSLSEHEREIFRNGEVSETQYIVGGILGTYPGLGIGHAVQGRYSDKGWMFTAGEIGTLAAFVAGIGDCWDGSRYKSCNNGLAFAGIVGYVGFRIWEIVDVWAGPREQNRRYREIKNMLERDSLSFQPILVPTSNGGMFGLNFSF